MEEWNIVVFDGQENMDDVLAADEEDLVLIKQEQDE